VSARRRTDRDQRRRTHGQNFLIDQSVIRRLVARMDVSADELVVEVGAGTGALTLALARAGARVIALEVDRVWARRLAERLDKAGLSDRVSVVPADVLRFRWPAQAFRVAGNPPFGLTSALLARILDRPDGGPARADLVLQREVARKYAAQPPTTLKGAAWAPWWTFALGQPIDRRAFRPVPGVDAALLRIERREPPILPTWLAPGFSDVLRAGWHPPPAR
jgi:23S rRNA (adenine-N6)-dimethyltransferase